MLEREREILVFQDVILKVEMDLLFTRLPKEYLPSWTVVVAQWVEWSPSTPEICGSNPVIGRILSNICLLSSVLKRRK